MADPASQCDADADLDPVSQNDADPDPQHWSLILTEGATCTGSLQNFNCFLTNELKSGKIQGFAYLCLF